MGELQEILSHFTNRVRDYDIRYQSAQNKTHRLEEQLEKSKNRLRKISSQCPRWIDEIVRPIATQLQERLPSYHHDVLGPFGICSEASIHFYENGVDKEHLWDGGHVKAIIFIPVDLNAGKIAIRDVSVNTHEYAPGTIAELNGMNHPTIDIPDDADIDWLLQYVRG